MTTYQGSALALLVARVLADHHDATVATNHLALVADLLNAGLNLHRCPADSSLVPVDNASPGQVVGRKLYDHAVIRKDPDVVHPHLPGDVGKDLVSVVQLDPEHGVRKRLDDRAFQLDRVVLLSHA